MLHRSMMYQLQWTMLTYMDEDTVLIITTPGVLINDFDADSDPLTAVLVAYTSHGTLTLNTDGLIYLYAIC